MIFENKSIEKDKFLHHFSMINENDLPGCVADGFGCLRGGGDGPDTIAKFPTDR